MLSTATLRWITVTIVLMLIFERGNGTPTDPEHAPAKLAGQYPTRGMVYLIKRGIDIPKPQYSLFQRVKRALGGEEEDKPQIKSLVVSSNITSRFSHTLVTSEMTNPWDTDKQATFRVLLPEKAFMSNFTMYIDGELYVAEVKSKDEAKEEYEKARDENKTAGLVEHEDWTPEEQVRGMEKFKMSVNVAAKSSIEFTLAYMELLERRFGLFEQRLSVRPDQLVDNLEVIVAIYEAQGITQVEVIEPGSNDIIPLYTTVTHVPEDIIAEISYNPTKDQQKSRSKDDQIGVKGELIVRYDVMHGDDLGLVQVEGDYFVHFFSPPSEDLEPLPKKVIFVIDISGSMSGDKIVQTRESMLVILDQLRPEDTFLIMLFDDKQEYWPSSKSQPVAASSSNIETAKGFVRENVKVDGGTNINDALVIAAGKLRSTERYGASMIVFLTDGSPTAGETNTENILANVHAAGQGKVSIFSLGFGFNLNFDLLRAISLRNGGFARRIYADIDADTQLQDFFREINTPLLYDINVDYGALQISLTKNRFAQYFQGSELVITGKFLKPAPVSFDAVVDAIAVEPWNTQKHIICDQTLVIPARAAKVFRPGSLERLYIYLKIKDLLDQVLMTDDSAEKERLEALALEMALEYHLVTPLTSFVVVQQEEVRPGVALESGRAYDMSMNMVPNLYAPSSRSSGKGSTLSLYNNAVYLCLILVVKITYSE